MSKLYNQICQNLILPLGDKFTRQCVMEYYSFVGKAQWWDRERLDEYQKKQLFNTLNTAYTQTVFYKELFDRHKIKLEHFKATDDLEKLPIVTKDMLREAYPKYCTIKTKWPWREYSTSGSTGRPFTVRVDNYSMSRARALMLLRANYSGWEVGDPCLQTGISLDRGFVKRIKDFILRVSYISAFNLSDDILDLCLERVERSKIEFVMGYAASLFCLAKRAKQVGFNIKLRGVVSWGDNLFSHYRKLIEEQFKCRITDSYGCGEGIQISAQCGQSNNEYHIFTPHVIVEFTKDGKAVQTGETGEIILTRLDPGAMPFIRYKIGDMGRASIRETCPCGRGLKLMESIEGRDADIIVTPNGNKLIVHFFTGIFEYASTIDNFQVVQEKPTEITIKIVPLRDFKKSDWDKVKSEIIEKANDPDLKINMEIVEVIPVERSSKRRFIISKLGG
jgi:phenylacetate-coenzyme A ligase PaaK-like adenylate-forming protein